MEQKIREFSLDICRLHVICERIGGRYQNSLFSEGSFMHSKDNFSVIALDKFIQATRDSGYKGTRSALSELVDNSIQAKATKIEIQILRLENLLQLYDTLQQTCHMSFCRQLLCELLLLFSEADFSQFQMQLKLPCWSLSW